MGSPIDCRWMAPSASARSPARRQFADPAHSCSQWVAAPRSPVGQEGLQRPRPHRTHRGHFDHQRGGRARRRPPSVYLKTVDPDRPTITSDLIQFFTGEAATKAAAEDGEESPPPTTTTSAT